MVPSILLAPAGHGKTHHCVARIREVLAAQPLAPVWAILPNRDQVRAFRRRLAEAGGAMGVHLGTFYAFYAEILARVGQPVPRLSDPVQHRLLRAIVDRLCDDGRLGHYASLRRKPGFIVALRTLIRELKRARIFPDAFAGAVADRGPRLTELAAIYTAYQDWLVRTGWADAEGQGWLAAIALDEHPDLCRDLRLLVVNGFDEFNPTQLAVLRGLAGRAAETIVTLTGDAVAGDSAGHTRLTHRRFARARTAVTAALCLSPSPLLPLSPSPPLPAPLAHLEASLFEPSSRRIPADGAVAFLEAPNRSEEVRAALRWLKARIVRDGMPPREVAVLARDLTAYRPFLEETAAEFGLPLRVATGTELETNPAVTALLSLLSLPAGNWPRRPVVDAWRSPYFDWSAQGMAEGDADRLDAASRFGLVIEGVEQWREALDRLAGMAPAGEAVAEDEEAAAPGVPAGAEAAALRRTFEAFVARLTPPQRGTVRDYVAFVEELIGDDPKLADRFKSPEDAVGAGSLGVVARAWENEATAARDIAALRAFKDVLRGLVLAESVLAADPPLPSPEKKPNLGANSPLPLGGGGPGVREGYANFIAELRSAVESTLYEVPTAGDDFILAAPILRARGLSFRAVASLGLSEGEFPRAEREDTLLREADRADLRARGLPLEPRLPGDEPNLFYQALTRARERLLLCRPYLADDGQPWEPSPYWRQVQQLVDAPTEHVRPEDPLPPEEVASPQELMMAAGGAVEHDPSPDDWLSIHDEARQHVRTGAAVLRARLAERATGPHEGDLSALAPALAARFDDLSGWSASRLESYGTCPLDFFVGYGLDLEPRRPPEVGFDVRTLGLMYHHILEVIYGRATDRTDLDELLASLPTVAKEEFDAAPEKYGFRPTPLWDHQRRELEDILRETLVGLAEASQGYIPRHFEPAFGFHEEPPLVLRGEGGEEVRFHGYIDRVDVGPDGRLRIVDYKAGGTAIAARDLAEGRRLQLGLYALAARDALGLGEVAGGFYWHIGKAQASSLKLEKFEGGVLAALDTAAGYALAYVAAIRAGRYEPHPPPGGCPRYCPATAFCWRYAPQRW